MKAQLCPVCGGCGKYHDHRQVYPHCEGGVVDTCHGCKGKGYVVVPCVEDSPSWGHQKPGTLMQVPDDWSSTNTRGDKFTGDCTYQGKCRHKYGQRG
jgi:hypothetical protein